jgi:LemA protein
MMPGFVLLIIGLGLPIIFVVLTFNTLVALRNHIRDAWANIDTELKRRHDLIPNLVATVKGYAAHEKEIFERVTALRSRCMAGLSETGQTASQENELAQAVKQMLALVENYPQLKANQHFLALQKQLTQTEDRIQAARRFFNGNVRDYRNKCETFPSNLVAGLFGFETKDYFQVTSADRDVPDVADY